VIFSAISVRLQRFDAVDRATGSGACGLEKTGCRRVGDSGVTGTLKGSLSLYSKPLFTEINGSKKTEEQIYTRTTKTSYIALAKWLTTSL